MCGASALGELRMRDSIRVRFGLSALLGVASVLALLTGCSGKSEVRPTSPPQTQDAGGNSDGQTTSGDSPDDGGVSYGKEGADSPEGAVELMMDGVTEGDKDKVLDATDPEYRDEPLGPANFGIFIQALFSAITGADIGQPDISFRDISMRTEYDADPNYATVYVSGRVRALGQEETLYDDPTFTVKSEGRWFVTTEEGSYQGVQERIAEIEEESLRTKESIEASVSVQNIGIEYLSDYYGSGPAILFTADVVNTAPIDHTVSLIVRAAWSCFKNAPEPNVRETSTYTQGVGAKANSTSRWQYGPVLSDCQPPLSSVEVCTEGVNGIYQDISLAGTLGNCRDVWYR